MIYMQQKNYEQASKYLTRAVTLDPENMMYRYHLATLFDYMGNSKMALRLYKQLLKDDAEDKLTQGLPEKIRDRAALLEQKLTKG